MGGCCPICRVGEENVGVLKIVGKTLLKSGMDWICRENPVTSPEFFRFDMLTACIKKTAKKCVKREPGPELGMQLAC